MRWRMYNPSFLLGFGTWMQEKLVLCAKPIFLFLCFLICMWPPLKLKPWRASSRILIMRIKNDKDVAPVAAGKRHLKLFPIEREGMIEMYERVVRN